jgi:hypothetical protein
MRKAVLLLTFLLLFGFLSGCGITIVPRPLASTDRINPSDRSIIKENSVISLSVRVQDTAVGGYSLATPITSFYVSVNNKRHIPVNFSQSSFVLVDGKGKEYQTVASAVVKELLSPEFDFFQPFPYVTILDVVDQESQRAASGMASERTYIGQGLARDPAGVPFPELPILSGSRGAGVVFFEIDLAMVKSVQLKVNDPVDAAVYIFPFFIE